MYLFYIPSPTFFQDLDGSRIWSNNSLANPGTNYPGMVTVCPSPTPLHPAPSALPLLQTLGLPQAHLGCASVAGTRSGLLGITAATVFPCLISGQCNGSNSPANDCLKQFMQLTRTLALRPLIIHAERWRGGQISLKIPFTSTDVD